MWIREWVHSIPARARLSPIPERGRRSTRDEPLLPPLLYAAARRTFAQNWSAIALQAVGFVVVTAAVVAVTVHLWHPAVPLAAAFVRGIPRRRGQRQVLVG
ncbi:hypothetical protein [Nocardia vulneris]|uniref:Uncharacterized protein n=1 Tax=Nocardia vulneris TaxID=1141657 RepID=A0ABR4Z665_9NOCA|nr:hypothetical protein [Nocardia vulneris]KIA60777.1 hypothetical protein FG87_35280 [Nocardia vulneris]